MVEAVDLDINAIEPKDWADAELREAAVFEVMERLVMACVREQLLKITRTESSVTLESDLGEKLTFPIAENYSMARFDLAELPQELAQDSDQSFVVFLERLFPDLPSSRREDLLRELHLSYLNLALSMAAKHELGLGEPGRGNLADWESKVWTGHPLHPGTRLRSGMSPGENQLYGPEWGADLELRLLSVPRDKVNLVGNFSDRVLSLFPRSGIKNTTERVHVPVHPWQAERDLVARFQKEFDEGEFYFAEETLPARPTMSFRTVILETEVSEDFHLKLPVAVQTTGATRTVSVASTQNGPRMSDFLKRLFSQREFLMTGLFDGLHLCAEPSSFHVKDDDPDRARFLSAILRRGPRERGVGARWILPAAALLEPRENPLFMRAADYYSVSVETLFDSYCRSLLPPMACLCGQFGIALEAHPQNVVVDFRGGAGSPPDIHFWYRDLGGIRLHSRRLAESLKKRAWGRRLQVPEFWPGSATATDSDRELSSKFVYSLLQNHLGELIRTLARQGVYEADLWPIVDDILEEHRSLMGQDLAARVFAEEWDLKAMWTMRMDLKVTEYTFQPVVNPLIQFRQEYD